MWDAAVSFTQKLGFPMFVATFLLLRVDKKLWEILVTLKGLLVVVKVLARLDADEDEPDDEEE